MTSLANLALSHQFEGELRQSQKDLKLSLSLYAKLFASRRHYFAGEFAWWSPQEALAFQERQFADTSFFHTLCCSCSAQNMDEANILGAEQLCMNKALVEEGQVVEAALEADLETATMEARQAAESVKLQLARLPYSKFAPDDREARRHELQSELSQLELKMAARVGLLAQSIRERGLTLGDVARALSPNAALLDFVEYLRADFTPKSSKIWQRQCYAAYLTFPLVKDSTNVIVQLVDLGESPAIDEAVQFISSGCPQVWDIRVMMFQRPCSDWASWSMRRWPSI